MKKRTLEITPRETHDIAVSAQKFVPTAYEVIDAKNERKKRVLLDNLTVVEVDRNANVQKLAIILTSSTNFTYTFDLNLPGVNHEAIKKFWQEHPGVASGIEPMEKQVGKIDPQYLFFFSEDALNTDLQNDEKRVEAYQKYKGLSEDEKRKVAVYFGYQEQNYDTDELFNEMASLDNGVLVTHEDSRDEFLNNLDAMFDPMVLNLRLAINNKLLMTDGDAYIIAGQVIGSSRSFNDCLATLKVRDDLYNAMIQNIKSAGLSPYGVNVSSFFEEEGKAGKGKGAQKKEAALPASKH